MGLSDAIDRMKKKRDINKTYKTKKKKARRALWGARKERIGKFFGRGKKEVISQNNQQNISRNTQQTKSVKADLAQQKADWRAKKIEGKENLSGMRRRAMRQRLSAFAIIAPMILIIIFVLATAVTAIMGLWLSTLLYLIGLIIFIYLMYFKGESYSEYGSYTGEY